MVRNSWAVLRGWADLVGRSLRASLVTGAVLAVLAGAGCSGDSHSPAKVLPSSRENFAKVESYRVRLHFTSQTGKLESSGESEAAYSSHKLAFGHYVLAGDAPNQQAITELLFIPPDLYLRMPDGRWFVISPWNQGIRPDAVQQFSPDDPIVDYVGITRALHNIKHLPDETIDGEEYMRYAGVVDVAALPPATPSGVAAPSSIPSVGTARADLWLHKGSYLPYKLQTSASLAGTDSSVATFEFFDYNRTPILPERPAGARPWRDLQLPEAPCTGARFIACLEAQTQLQSLGRDSCDGSSKRICLVPLGQISSTLIQRLADYYRNQYGLTVAVLAPRAVPAELANPLREQVDATALIDYMRKLSGDAASDPQAVLVGLTPVDLYDETSHFRYVFGFKETPADPKAVISTFRMNAETYGEPSNDELLFSRARKLLSKYIGLLFYDLPSSSDPTSPLYNSILGPDDLDRMQEPLPVSTVR